MRSLLLLVVFSGCPAKHHRPATALELCEQLRGKFDASAECVALTAPDKLALMAAVEGATVRALDPNTRAMSEVAWVAFTDTSAKPTLAGMLHQVGRQLAQVALLEEHNDAAGVGLYVVRGQVSASHWEAMRKHVTRLTPAE